ncbi:MAG: hypothetical protein GKR89_11115 [Candidatus Latescibacteria bacterium]|nr:hypothetical protein [Candidatus Latescibacterota bacterium]
MKQIPPLTVVGLLLCLATGLDAHQGERLFPIVELTDADLEAIDLHDGTVDDWLTVVGEPTVTALDFFAQTNLEPYDPADMDFRIWLAWHDGTDRLYAAMEQVDDIYVNNFDRNSGNFEFMWHQDSAIRLELDGDHSGGAFNTFPCCNSDEPAQAFEFARQAQPYNAIGQTVGDDPHVAIDVLQNLNPPAYEFGDWYTRPPYAEGGGGRFGENPVISVTEFYVTPFDHMVWSSQEESRASELSLGRTIGFRLTAIDRDNKDEFINAWFTLPSNEGLTPDQNRSSDFFADGLLLGPGGALPKEEDDTAVEGLSWGRIKASFY